jgi:hypothetical protein
VPLINVTVQHGRTLEELDVASKRRSMRCLAGSGQWSGGSNGRSTALA